MVIVSLYPAQCTMSSTHTVHYTCHYYQQSDYERIAFNVKYSEEVRHCHHGLAPEQHGSFHLLLRPLEERILFYQDENHYWRPSYFGKTLLISWASWARLMNPEGKSTWSDKYHMSGNSTLFKSEKSQKVQETSLQSSEELITGLKYGPK